MGYTGNPILRFVIYIAEKEKRRKENPLWTTESLFELLRLNKKLHYSYYFHLLV